MRIFTALVLFVSLSFCVSAQQAELQSTLDNYFKANNEANWEKMTSYIYPTFFEHQDKQQMLDIYAQTYDAGYHSLYENVRISSVEKNIKSDGKTYTLLKATGTMKLKITSTIITESGMKSMKNSLEATHGDENVSFNSSENTFEIKMDNIKFYGVQQDKKWYLLNNNSALYPIISKCIPVDVLSELNGEAKRVRE